MRDGPSDSDKPPVDAVLNLFRVVYAGHGRDAIAANPDAAQWLALAREQADRAQQLPGMPDDPTITNDGLKPYLGRWSPYGPQEW
jgi:hypothetical protein